MAAYNGYQALPAAKSAQSILNAKQGLLAGDPRLTFLAVKKLIERERDTRAATVGTQALEDEAHSLFGLN